MLKYLKWIEKNKFSLDYFSKDEVESFEKCLNILVDILDNDLKVLNMMNTKESEREMEQCENNIIKLKEISFNLREESNNN